MLSNLLTLFYVPTILVVIISAIYFVATYPIYNIARNIGAKSPWRAWVPIFNLFLMLDMAGFSYLYAFLFLLSFIKPFGIVTLIFSIVIWYKIAGRIGSNRALSFLLIIPLVNIIILYVFSFQSDKNKEVYEQRQKDREKETQAPTGTAIPRV